MSTHSKETGDLYLSQVTCPVCRNIFSMHKARKSKVRLMRRDEDFCGYYATVNPTFYAVYACPHCGYAAFESDYDRVSPKEKLAVREFITTKWNPKDHGGLRSLDDAIAVHQLCLLNYNFMNRKPSDLGKICLRLAWFYRMQQNVDKEQIFLRFSVEQYTKAYEIEKLEVDADNQLTIYYLLGELNRRIGDYDKAAFWFLETLQLPAIKLKKQMATLTRDQLQLTKEERKQKSENPLPL